MFLALLIFLVTTPSFAVSPEQGEQLKKEWMDFCLKKVTVQPKTNIEGSISEFINNSHTIYDLVSQSKSLSWNEIAVILANTQKDVIFSDEGFLQEGYSQIDFDLDITRVQIILEINQANEHRFHVMELAEMITTFENELRKKDEEELRKRRLKNYQDALVVAKEMILYYQGLKEPYQKEIDDLQKNSVSSSLPLPKGANTRARLKAKLEQKRDQEQDALHLKWLQESMKNYNQRLASYQKDITKLEKLSRNINKIKVESDLELIVETPLPLLKGGMPVLQLLQGGLSGDKLRNILRTIGQDLFLTPEAFEAMDMPFLNEQYLFSIKANDMMENKVGLSNLPQTISQMQQYCPDFSVNHITAYQKLVYHIFRLHELELKRRKLLESSTLKPSRTPIEDPEEIKIEENPISEENPDLALIYLKETQSKKLNLTPPQVTIPLEHYGNHWTVIVKKYVKKEADSTLSNDQLVSLSELIQYLGENGPMINDSKISLNNRWRNFSVFSTKKDFHCHIGSSNTVVVWRMLDPKQKIITIYYLGTHPSGYKQILKKNISVF